MKRIFGLALFSLGALALFGCPVYPGSGGGGGGNCSYGDCPSSCQTNYDCPTGLTCYQGSCVQTTGPGNTCTTPSACPTGQNCGSDGVCQSGDCSSSGCPTGYVCELAGGTLQCVTSTDAGVGDATVDGPSNGDANPDGTAPDGTAPDGASTDGSTGDTSPPPFTGCTNNGACSAMGAGAQCLDGVCYSAANQCSDATQCTGTEQCVQGVCTPVCATSGAACPSGFSCNATTNVCTGNPTPCGDADGGESCSAGTTCVQEHCVAPCGDGGTCTGGLVCVDGGCIPNQQPKFICNVDGQQDLCASGSICLHHNCYIACSADAGVTSDGGSNGCQNADQFNICKAVSTSTGTYYVCGSNSNLGNQCDPTQSENCTSPAVCIDGYCR